MFDNYNPDFDIESNNFDLFIQKDPDLFYKSIDHEFPELNHGKEWFINEFRQWETYSEWIKSGAQILYEYSKYSNFK